jgi:hypothetical protein
VLTYLDIRKNVAALNHEREIGMSRPHSDKVFIHAGLRPEAHKALYDYLTKLGNGSIKPGVIGDWLSDLILEEVKLCGFEHPDLDEMAQD